MINLLKSLPRYNETFGSIKSDKGLVYVKADFNFSVKKIISKLMESMNGDRQELGTSGVLELSFVR